MKLSFNTLVVDVSVALDAIRQYESGAFNEAISALLTVLDLEPTNWEARLMLAACYYKTGQWFAAQRAFDFICEHVHDIEMRSKALEGLAASRAKLGVRAAMPAEFGCHVEYLPVQKALSWL